MPNEIIYDFADLPLENFNRFRLIYRKRTETPIIWVNAVVKHRYDNQNLAINSPKVFFRLHHGYTIPGMVNKN